MASAEPPTPIWRSTLIWVLGAFVVGIAIAGLVVVTRPQAKDRPAASRSGSVASPSGASAGQRVVRLTTAPGAVSDDGQTLAVLLSGAMPHGTVRATVMSDENCDPDARGYSHCLNDVRLADGSVLHLRHNHRMAAVPCLGPGEEVLLKGT